MKSCQNLIGVSVASHILCTLVARPLDDADNAAVFGTTCAQSVSKVTSSGECDAEETRVSTAQVCCHREFQNSFCFGLFRWRGFCPVGNRRTDLEPMRYGTLNALNVCNASLSAWRPAVILLAATSVPGEGSDETERRHRRAWEIFSRASGS